MRLSALHEARWLFLGEPPESRRQRQVGAGESPSTRPLTARCHSCPCRSSLHFPKNREHWHLSASCRQSECASQQPRTPTSPRQPPTRQRRSSIICGPLLYRPGCYTPRTYTIVTTASPAPAPAPLLATTTNCRSNATCHQYQGANSLHGRCLKPHSLSALRRWRTS